ncbi:MAG TPA: gamma carbonic anhydrase family protein [Longimicrobiales bacterium]|nr:gamma carbonic anhydrase family protein [Longimicrobiales bacterium]
MALILPFGGKTPTVAADAFLAPTAVLIGDVTVGPEASIWFGAVLRGDDPENGIVVGPRTSVQDNCVIHVGGWRPTVIGGDCTIGHGAAFESCTIGDGTVVGMNAVVLQDAVIGEECLVAAGAVVKQGVTIPPRSLLAGVPATVRKTLEGPAARWVEGGGRHYVELSRTYLAEGIGQVGEAGTGAQPG